ncbi:MAG: LuxR C-terminal-related transcriptional regulator, partial [Spirochaetaceae bacterium]
MEAFLELLSVIDLTRSPPEVLEELRRSVERHCAPRWMALLHKEPLDGNEYLDPTFTSSALRSLLPSRETSEVSEREDPNGTLLRKPLEGPATELSPELAAILGTEPGEIARFLEENAAFHLFGQPVMHNNQFYGYFAVGSGREFGASDRSFLKAVNSLLAHFYRVCEVIAYDRTKSAAFDTHQLPAFITDQRGRVLEANEAFRSFFGCYSSEELQGARLEELFSLHNEKTLRQLFRKEHLARPVVAATRRSEIEPSGVLHSVAGERVPQGAQLRYFYFLPDVPGFSVNGGKEPPQRRYPQLELPQELSLTAREIDVAVRIAAGESSKEIARLLNVSIRTVQFH